MTSPIVSVILPVYNGADYIRDSIESILAQTFTNFELIVINDGSTDGTKTVLETLSDERLICIHQENKGLAATLNRGIALTRGKYIARQDHDDLSLPDRLEKQVEYMEAHPDCALLGTRSRIWVGNTPTERGHDHPLCDADLRFALLFDSPFVHTSVMLRREAVVAEGGYTTDPARQPPEDYELWSRLVRGHKVGNLPQRLVVYRELPDSIVRTVFFQDKLVDLCSENLASFLGVSLPHADITDIAALTHMQFDRVSSRPSLRRMRGLIHQAAKKCHCGISENNVRQMAEEKIRTLKMRLVSRHLGLLRAAVRAARDFIGRAGA